MGDEPITKVSIIISKGSLEGTYPGLIMANGARAEGIEVNLFFTFFGLDAIHKGRYEHIKVATVGNPGMHMATLVGVLPGMSAIATHMMEKKIDRAGHPGHPGVHRAHRRHRGGPLRLQGVGRHVRTGQGRLRRAGRGHHHRRRVLRHGCRRPDHLHLAVSLVAAGAAPAAHGSFRRPSSGAARAGAPPLM